VLPEKTWQLHIPQKLIAFGLLALVVLGACLFEVMVNKSGWANSKRIYNEKERAD